MLRIYLIRFFLWTQVGVFCHAQGPLDGYLKGKGVLDFAPSFSFNNARKFQGAPENVYDEIYKGQMLSLFAEYGLSERLDLVATASMVFTATQSGLQDGGAFIKFRPFYRSMGAAGKLGAIAGLGMTFPLSDYSPTTTGALGRKAVTLPLQLILQWETPLGLFFNCTAGYHNRLDKLNPADIAQVRLQRPDFDPTPPKPFTTFLLKTGFPARHYYLDAWVEWQNTREGSDYMPGVPDLSQAFRVSYTQVGGTLYYSDTGKNGFYLSGGYILKGRNVSHIARLTFGFVFKWTT
ncbi:MAG: hypothetical protein JNJ57_22250 [Saprospiraceae bacterium]|nr:hypothetical protein [Saprospiraceae bacterium]